MILTEKEAATKSCVRSGGQGWAPGPMPDADTLPVWRCVGSRCMAWTWNGPEPRATIILIKPGLEDPGDHWALIAEPTATDIGDERMKALTANPGARAFKSVPPVRTGFCGLAKP